MGLEIFKFRWYLSFGDFTIKLLIKLNRQEIKKIPQTVL